jgi:hypothetical protein
MLKAKHVIKSFSRGPIARGEIKLISTLLSHLSISQRCFVAHRTLGANKRLPVVSLLMKKSLDNETVSLVAVCCFRMTTLPSDR